MKYVWAALLFCIAIAAPAMGATPPPQSSGTTTSANVAVTGWKLECDPGKTTLACHMLNQIVSSSNGALVIGFTIVPRSDGQTMLTMQVPLGTSVRTPIGVSVTGGPSQTYQFLMCSQQGCFAAAPINADLLTAMRAGKGELRVTYALLDTNLVEHDVTASLSLAGFSQVYDRLK
jgi:invasion protein IalB